MIRSSRSLTLVPLLAAALRLAAQPGALDPTFLPIDVSTGQLSGFDGLVQVLVGCPDGKVLAGGNFTHCNGVERNGVARLNADGTLDLAFDPGFGANGMVWCMALQPDGRVLVGGGFTYFNGEPAKRLVRLLADGSVDPDFSVGGGFNHDVYSVAVQEDGRVLAGGDFNQFMGEPHGRLLRLEDDGTLDEGFDPGTCLGGSVNALAVQPDGRILIGGNFSEVQEQPITAVARLHPTGELDATFSPPVWSFSMVTAIALHADGAVAVGGMIPNGVVRLMADGHPDPGFNTNGPGLGGWAPMVNSLAALPDGGILVAGRFNAYNGVACGNVVKVAPTGAADPTFDTGSGADAEVFALATTPDGQALIGGLFDHVDQQPRPRIARLLLTDFSTGVPGLADVELEAWPNPTEGLVNLRWAGLSPTEAELLAPDGRLLQRIALGRGLGTVDLSALPPGTYLLRLYAEGGWRTLRLQRA